MLTLNKNETFYNKFLGSLIKNGNKSAAKRILDKSLEIVSERTRISPSFVLRKIFPKLHCYLEIKKIKIRKNIHIVPFPLTSKRQNFLKIKWILDYVKKNNRRVDMSQKLATEFINIIKNKKAKILLTKNSINREAVANKSNLHYRW
jgi:small subunit ribosomal protein S7